MLEWFENNASNPRLTVSATSLAETFSYNSAVDELNDATRLNRRFVFDGQYRFAQIHHQGFSSETDYADAVVLTRLGSKTSHYWHGPLGTRIETIEFVDDGVNVILHGTFLLNEMQQTISKADAVTLFIPWLPDGEPESGLFDDELLSRDDGA